MVPTSSISVSKPASGIITAWYGMNMPKRNSVNTASAPGKRHFDRT